MNAAVEKLLVGTCTHGSRCRFQHAERGGGGMERDADNSAPAAAAAERRPPEVAPARGAHPSSPVGTELTEAEIAEVLAASSNADAGHGSTSRKLGSGGVRTFLSALQRDPSMASVLAKNDFPYHGGPGARGGGVRETWTTDSVKGANRITRAKELRPQLLQLIAPHTGRQRQLSATTSSGSG